MASITIKQTAIPHVDRSVECRIRTMVVSPAATPSTERIGMRAKDMPISGAIPSPPLNPVKTDFQCPMTAAPPATSIKSVGTPNAQDVKTEAPPFATSQTNTREPVLRPTLKKTLAVPARVLPVEKTSTPRIRDAIWANGIAPKKYPAATAKITFCTVSKPLIIR